MPESNAAPAPKPRLPIWVKALLVGSVALMAVGVAAPFFTSSPPPSGGGGASTVSALTNSLGASKPTDTPATETGIPWSPAVFKLGFSFFVGFVVAYALRWFLRTALIAAGMMALFLFGLQYAGFIEVKWGAMEAKYDAGSSWVSRQTESFSSFITGALPSAGAAGVGLFAGMRRKL